MGEAAARLVQLGQMGGYLGPIATTVRAPATSTRRNWHCRADRANPRRNSRRCGEPSVPWLADVAHQRTRRRSCHRGPRHLRPSMPPLLHRSWFRRSAPRPMDSRLLGRPHGRKSGRLPSGPGLSPATRLRFEWPMATQGDMNFCMVSISAVCPSMTA